MGKIYNGFWYKTSAKNMKKTYHKAVRIAAKKAVKNY